MFTDGEADKNEEGQDQGEGDADDDTAGVAVELFEVLLVNLGRSSGLKLLFKYIVYTLNKLYPHPYDIHHNIYVFVLH